MEMKVLRSQVSGTQDQHVVAQAIPYDRVTSGSVNMFKPEPIEDQPQGLNRYWSKVHSSIGFKKGYNFILFFIFAGAMLGFCLARVQYLDINGIFKKNTAPGEWYWYRHSLYRIGITIHLSAVLPAGLLMVWQFVPIIRHKAMLFHRINGYTVITLVFVANAGAAMIARRAFGGILATQTGIGLLLIITTVSITLAYVNIKRLQIDQHRAWMLRTMFYLGTIITLRLIQRAAWVIIVPIGSYYKSMSCDEITYLFGGATKPVFARYPSCASNSGGYVAVRAGAQGPEQAAVGLQMSFALSTWLAIVIHVVGVEIYLHLTPGEAQRLRVVSYERQLKAGFKRPGSAGLTSDRFGDAEAWVPPA